MNVFDCNDDQNQIIKDLCDDIKLLLLLFMRLENIKRQLQQSYKDFANTKIN